MEAALEASTEDGTQDRGSGPVACRGFHVWQGGSVPWLRNERSRRARWSRLQRLRMWRVSLTTAVGTPDSGGFESGPRWTQGHWLS